MSHYRWHLNSGDYSLKVPSQAWAIADFVCCYFGARFARFCELWDLPTAYKTSQTVVIWDVFLSADEQLGFPWPCCRQGSASQPFCPALEWWPGFAALAGKVQPVWVQKLFSNRAPSRGLCKLVLELPCAWRGVSGVAKCLSAPGDPFYAPPSLHCV